ncbi:hypothetical protein KP014_25500 [Paenibacillus sophorae]|uniref:Uncharacterized protein n=1 Tax=Paenibacillus sophorae TaxID=1333845 RepID=A0ABX8HAF3_9BACL|nr:hypothetical protein [Paenibacillus sophorae]QWU15204.1 hypothetical protein KP014_25500 [Paenibacillus sophorae]
MGKKDNGSFISHWRIGASEQMTSERPLTSLLGMQCPDVSGNLLRFRRPKRKTPLSLSKATPARSPCNGPNVHTGFALAYRMRAAAEADGTAALGRSINRQIGAEADIHPNIMVNS